jgi:hypothetical protein
LFVRALAAVDELPDLGTGDSDEDFFFEGTCYGTKIIRLFTYSVKFVFFIFICIFIGV